jgi:hypothetical protein
MKIYTTRLPKFTHQGKEYWVDTKMFASFGEFEQYLKERNPNIVYIYSVTNVDIDDNLIHPCIDMNNVDENISLITIRFKLI